MKEALSQLYAYTGFPRSHNALGSLKKVMEQRGDVTMGPEASPLPAGYDALKQGTEVQTRLTGQPFDYTFCPAEDYYSSRERPLHIQNNETKKTLYD